MKKSIDEKTGLFFFGAFAGLNVGALLYCFVFMTFIIANATYKSMDDLYMKQPAPMNHTTREAKEIGLLIFPICVVVFGLLIVVLRITRDNWEKFTTLNEFAMLPLAFVFFVYYIFVPMYR